MIKIFFEDGEIATIASIYQVLYVDASEGPTANRDFLNYIQQNPQYYDIDKTIIYTNSLVALNNRYCWDEATQTCLLYLRDKKGNWQLAQDLIEREIRQAHNLMTMYLNGVWD